MTIARPLVFSNQDLPVDLRRALDAHIVDAWGKRSYHWWTIRDGGGPFADNPESYHRDYSAAFRSTVQRIDDWLVAAGAAVGERVLLLYEW